MVPVDSDFTEVTDVAYEGASLVASYCSDDEVIDSILSAEAAPWRPSTEAQQDNGSGVCSAHSVLSPDAKPWGLDDIERTSSRLESHKVRNLRDAHVQSCRFFQVVIPRVNMGYCFRFVSPRRFFLILCAFLLVFIPHNQTYLYTTTSGGAAPGQGWAVAPVEIILAPVLPR